MQPITINVAGNLVVGHPLSASLSLGRIEQFGELASTVSVASNEAPIKILADGTHLPAGSDRTDHVAVLHADGWMICTATLSDNGESFDTQSACIKACQALRVLGFDDWQLAPRHVWECHVLDLERHDPAVDPSLYPGIKSGWHHTSTDCAWTKDKKTGVASSAWLVDSYYGLVSGDRRGSDGFGLAARRVGQ